MTPDALFSHLVLVPVVAPLAAGALGILLLRKHPRTMSLLALAAVLAGTASMAVVLAQVARTGEPVVVHVGGWRAPFGINLVGDLLGALMTLMAQAVMVGGVLYARGCRDSCVHFPVFYPLLLALAGGLSGTMLTGDLFNFFVFAELVMISGTVLTACADNTRGVEAAYKYFYISLVAATGLLLANGCLYAGYGTLNMADLARHIAAAPDAPLAHVALALLLVSLGIKAAGVPFHFWQPDFHAAAPTPVSAMLSSVVVKLGVYGLFRVSTLLYPHEGAVGWVLIGMGVLGVVVGGLGAAGTHDLKRMLAYSTLAQIGFILAALGWGSPAGVAAALVFTVNHAFVKSAMLMLAGLVASRAPVKSASFATITGVGRTLPWAGVLFVLGGMALMGLPPTNGFLSKFGVLRAGVDEAAWVVLGVLGLGSVVTMVYVARAFQRVWWQAPAPDAGEVKPYHDSSLAPALLIGVCVALGVMPQPLLDVAGKAAAWMQDPARYIDASLGLVPEAHEGPESAREQPGEVRP